MEVENNDYKEKLREINATLNRIPQYMQSPEFRKAVENTQKIAAVLGNMVVVMTQSEAV